MITQLEKGIHFGAIVLLLFSNECGQIYLSITVFL